MSVRSHEELFQHDSEVVPDLGIVLEELFVGTRTDIRAGLQEASDKAKEILKQ